MHGATPFHPQENLWGAVGGLRAPLWSPWLCGYWGGRAGNPIPNHKKNP
jgi:hypothetical protein